MYLSLLYNKEIDNVFLKGGGSMDVNKLIDIKYIKLVDSIYRTECAKKRLLTYPSEVSILKITIYPRNAFCTDFKRTLLIDKLFFLQA